MIIIRCILTPNKVEFERLVNATITYYSQPIIDDGTSMQRESYILSLQNGKIDSGDDSSDSTDDYRKVYALSKALGGITILKKGTQARVLLCW